MNLVKYWTVLAANEKADIVETYNEYLPLAARTENGYEIFDRKPGLEKITLGMLPFMDRKYIINMLNVWYSVGSKSETSLDTKLRGIITKLGGELKHRKPVKEVENGETQ